MRRLIVQFDVTFDWTDIPEEYAETTLTVWFRTNRVELFADGSR